MTAEWRVSSYSGTTGDCVEMHCELDRVRDSKNRDGGAVAITRGFVSAIKDGRFDAPQV